MNIGSISFTTLCHSCFYQIKPILRWVRSRQCMRWRSSMSSKTRRILPQKRYGHVSKCVIAHLCEIINKKWFFQTIPTNVTVTEFVSMTTFKMQPWAFLAPVNRFNLGPSPAPSNNTVLLNVLNFSEICFRSYLCTDDGRQTMHTELHRSDGK